MKRKYYLTLIVIVSITIVMSCKKETKVTESAVVKSTKVPVTVIEASVDTFNEYGEYYGRTRGVHRASLINIPGGTVESVDVVEGAKVKKGDSLAKISHESAEISLESAILNEKMSADNYSTLYKFLQSGNSTPKNVDQAKLAWLSSQTGLINAKKAYDSAFCIAPIDGVVVSRNIDIDDEVRQGQNTFLIEDLTKIEIEIGIPEADMNGVGEGSKAEVYFDLYPGRIWEGELTRFSRRSSDNNLTFNAVIIVNNSDETILSGITAKVKLLRNSFNRNIVIPTQVVSNNQGNSYVMVIDGDKVHKQNVVIGASDVEKCVVLNGVSEGDLLVDEGLHLLVDSQEVSIVSKEL